MMLKSSSTVFGDYMVATGSYRGLVDLPTKLNEIKDY